MRAPLVLLAHSLKRLRILVLTMGILLAAFQGLLVMVARSIQSTGGFEQLSAMLPPFARELMGPSIATFMSFGGIVSLGYFHLAVTGSLVGLCIAIATTPAAEIETGFIDFILARPLARHWIVTRSIAAALLSIVFLLGCMLLGTLAGLHSLAPEGVGWPPAQLIRSLALNLGLLLLAWSGIALALGCGSRRRSVAGAITGLLALATFLIDYVGRLWQPAESVAWLSPFRYYSPLEMVMGGPLPLKNVGVLGGIAVAGFLAGYVLFARRDISH